MSLIVHHQPQAFLAAALLLVAHDPARSAGLKAFIGGAERSAVEVETRMALWRGERAGAAFYQRGDGPVVIGACESAAARACAAWMASSYPDLGSVVGSEAACEAFSAAWLARTGGTRRVRTRMRNHVLTELVEPRAVPGGVRTAQESDLEWLLEHQRAFAEEAGVPDSLASMIRSTRERLATGGLRIWRDQVDVAYAGCVEAGPDAARVAPVYTLKAHRGRGYASAVVASIVRDQLAARRSVFLVTDIANPTSNAIYARLGFRPLDDFVTVDLLTPS